MRQFLLALVCASLIARAAAAPEPFFATGQAADLMISGYGFNRTAGPLRFNHPAGIAIAEGRLVLADRNNNRVLIWEGVPETPETAPAFALGQSSFDSNAPGTGLDELNWPTAVASDGTSLYVADTYNHRILVWRRAPTRMKQPADFAITSASGIRWPWGIWTDGRRLAVSQTQGGRVQIWDRLPESDARPDRELRSADFGTPRTIESDGARLLVSDHNARVNNGAGNFFWRTFPASEAQRYDFFMAAPPAAQGGNPSGGAPGEHIHDATFLSDGRFLAVFNRSLCVWSVFPRDATDACAVSIGQRPGTTPAIDIDAGDNSGVAVHEGRLFVSLNNGNRVLVFNRVPEGSGEAPSFAIGSPDVSTNTLATDAIVTNGVPLSDGQRLWVTSDYDRKMYIWRSLPESDGQKPDAVQSLDFGPWDSTRLGDGLALAGTNGTVAIWTSPPDGGRSPDQLMRGSIGGVTLGDLRGIAWDGTFFYLASYDRHRVWVWRGVPNASAAPVAELEVTQPSRLSSDGRFLAVATGGNPSGVRLYEVARLMSSAPAPVTVGPALRMNLPQDVLLSDGALFIADTNSNRVLCWRDAADAYEGRDPDAVLGATDLRPREPAIGQSTLFWPGALGAAGSRLWVGEFKFSNRIVRFSRQ